MKTGKKGHLSALASALRFTAADLEANRRGLIAPGQLGKAITIKLSQHPNIFSAFIVFGVWDCILCTALSAATESSPLGLWAIFIFFLLPPLFALLPLGRILLLLLRDRRDRRVAALSGHITLSIQAQLRGSARYRLSILGETFNIPETAAIIFHHGRPYTLYYLPHSRVILSAEPYSTPEKAKINPS